MTTAHATPTEYTALTGKTTNALALLRASLDVDAELICAVYDPADPEVLAALREATILHALRVDELGGVDGAPPAVSSVTAGKVSMSGIPVRADGTIPLDGRALTVLQLAGLTGHAPATGYGSGY